MKLAPYLILFALLAAPAPAAAAAAKPVPRSPYLPLIYRYADALLAKGRDAHGPLKTDLLLSALDRAAFTPVPERPLADPVRDQNLLRVLQTLSDLSGKPVYRAAADAELAWFLENASARDAKLAPWDEGLAWDVAADKPVPADRNRDPARPWVLWDRCFKLSPDASKALTLGLAAATQGATPRRLGFSVRAWGAGYRHTKDQAFVRAAASAVEELERREAASAPERLSVAIDCAGAAGRFPTTVASRLRNLAAREDRAFLALPHDLAGKGGFAHDAAAASVTPLWTPAKGGTVRTTAAVAMMCVSRYENSGDVRFRRLIHGAADVYRRGVPAADADLVPLDFGHAISLQLAAWRSSSRQEYLDTAIRFADLAVEQLWSDGPLPRAARGAQHYDTASGVDTLALALVELHLSILHITAVQCPPNTIDR